MKRLLSLIIAFFISQILFSQTAGTMTFTATTVNYTAEHSPKHILAIWIADNSGNWVKTRKFMSSNPSYRQFLTNFKNATSNSYNATDAITGSTISNHNTGVNNPQNVSWNGKNNSGTLLADGTYRVYIEFTSANATGKVYYCSFVKGAAAIDTTYANQTYFNSIHLTWTPDLSETQEIDSEKEISVFPNPAEGEVNLTNASGSDIEIYDVMGKVIFEKHIIFEKELLNRNHLTPGKYYIKINKDNKAAVKSLILI